MRVFRERVFDLDDDKLSRVAVTIRLSERDLRNSLLSGSDLRKADLFKADLGGADLSQVRLNGANMTEANLSSDIKVSGLYSLTLGFLGKEDELRHATNLTKADLTDAILSGANLKDAQGLTQRQLDSACGDDKTKLPAGMTIMPCLDKP